MVESLPALVREIRQCRACAEVLPHEPRPVLQVSGRARLCIVGQAPGTRVHDSGVPFTDPSGDRLRAWLGIDAETFYDSDKVAIIPMGFCFPGLDAKGGDLPPRKECAQLWRARLFAALPAMELTLLVGQYAQAWHLGAGRQKNLTETVRGWRDYLPAALPMPHPSWRNNSWLKRNPWFETDLLPDLRQRVQQLI